MLVIKTPTARYAPDEVRAIVQFVQAGGSLLLIGDHTNVFNMNTYLNDIARQFGFTFRNDLLFRVGTPYKQPYAPPVVAHPIVQHVPPMDFAVSCSIDPGRSAGRMVIRSTRLVEPAARVPGIELPSAGRVSAADAVRCLVPAVVDDVRPGAGAGVRRLDALLELLRVSTGKGRTAARHAGLAESPQPLGRAGRSRSAGLGLCRPRRCVLVVIGVWCSPRRLAGARRGGGWPAGASPRWPSDRLHAGPCPSRQDKRPLPHVVIDRTVSEVPLFTGAFTDGEEGVGYGMLEQWIPRLGSRTLEGRRRRGIPRRRLVIVCPTRSVVQLTSSALSEFVAAGGDLLVLDSADVEGSTANSLLWPFGLSSRHDTPAQENAKLRCAFSAPEVPLAEACEISGGEPLAWLGETPVAAQARHGQGTVTAVGFGSLFNDENMGFHWLPEPEPAVRERYEVLYGLLRRALPKGDQGQR